MVKVIKFLGGLLAILAVIALVGYLLLNEELPEGVEGRQAEELTDELLRAVNKAAWDTTENVSWNFAGIHQFNWNKQTDSVIVKWDDHVVHLHTKTVTGKAYLKGQRLSDQEADELIQKAWSYFCNDSFWLAAPFKVRDPGTSRKWVDLPNDNRGLLVSYESGGVTPGDAYLWIIGPDGMPKAWKMWTSIIPLGGIQTSWSNWQTLSSGAKVSALHATSIIDLKLTDIK